MLDALAANPNPRTMRRPFLPFLPLLLAAAPLPAQGTDILFYRFDESYGTSVINYAAGSPAPAEGTIISLLPGTPQASWAPGRFGGALAGSIASPNQYNRVDTGWIPGTWTGSLSWAMWVELAYSQPAPSLCYVAGSPTANQFRVFTGTSGLFFTAGLGYASQSSTANVYQLASQGWVHVAYVADAASLTSVYYINGIAEAPRTITAAPTWTSPVPFTVGQQLVTSPGSVFHIDEFLLTGRVLSAAEVLALASSSRAGDGRYAGGCGGMTLASTGGPPTVGNLLYGLQLTSPTVGICLLGIGTNRSSFSGVPLPFDLGSSLGGGPCLLDTSFESTLFLALGPTASVGLPIPPNQALSGFTVYAQAPGILGGSTFAMSNPFSIGVGN